MSVDQADGATMQLYSVQTYTSCINTLTPVLIDNLYLPELRLLRKHQLSFIIVTFLWIVTPQRNAPHTDTIIRRELRLLHIVVTTISGRSNSRLS